MASSTHNVALQLGALDQSHYSGKERLQMNDWFRTFAAATLKKHSILEHHRLDLFGKCAAALCGLKEFSR